MNAPLSSYWIFALDIFIGFYAWSSEQRQSIAVHLSTYKLLVISENNSVNIVNFRIFTVKHFTYITSRLYDSFVCHLITESIKLYMHIICLPQNWRTGQKWIFLANCVGDLYHNQFRYHEQKCRANDKIIMFYKLQIVSVICLRTNLHNPVYSTFSKTHVHLRKLLQSPAVCVEPSSKVTNRKPILFE